MPILVNNQSGLAEDLAKEDADRALASGTHELPLNDPQGNPITAPLDQAQDLLKQGYSQPDTGQLQNLMDYSKFSSTPEQLKAFVEGAGVANTFGLSTAAERAAGVDPQDILKRSQINPGAHMAGEGVGLGVSALTGMGEAKVIGTAGKAVAELAGLGGAGAGIASRVGSAAVKNAVETAMVTTGSEVSKMVASDPNQSAETALAEVGLSAVIGAGLGAPFGAVAPLWEKAAGSKAGQLLNAIRDKANGAERSALPGDLAETASRVGVQLTPEMRSALSDLPEAKGLFQELQESTTRSGKAVQQSVGNLRSGINDAIVSSLGKTPQDLEALGGLSEFDEGTKLKSTLVNELKGMIDPVAEKFEAYKSQMGDAQFPHHLNVEMGEKIGQLIQDERYDVFPDVPQAKLANQFLKGVPELRTMGDLAKVQSLINEATSGFDKSDLWHVGKNLRGIFRDAEESATETILGAKSPEMLADRQVARGAYKNVMGVLDDLNDRLRVGRYSGPQSFLSALKDMSPEDVLRRMGGRADAGLFKLLGERLPLSGDVSRQYQLNQVLKNAVGRAGPGESIKPAALFAAMEKMAPEAREFVLPRGAESKLGALKELLEAIPTKMNTSGTAKTLDALWAHMPAGAMSMLGVLTGHGVEGGAMGYVLGSLAHWIGREAPDAMKLATLKFLGNGQPVSAPGFKAGVEFLHNVIRGESSLTKSSRAIFGAGSKVAPQAVLPDEKQLNKLKTKLNSLRTSQLDLLNVGGHSGYYLPEAAQGLAMASGRAVSYLQNLIPKEDPMGPLGAKRVPSAMEEYRFKSAANVAEAPLHVLSDIPKGNITPTQIQDLKAMYPSLYARMASKVAEEMTTHLSKGNTIPYSTRMGIAMFLGQPLDNSMMPASILAAQPKNPMPNPEGGPMMGKVNQSGMNKMGKASSLAMTQQQARQRDLLSKG